MAAMRLSERITSMSASAATWGLQIFWHEACFALIEPLSKSWFDITFAADFAKRHFVVLCCTVFMNLIAIGILDYFYPDDMDVETDPKLRRFKFRAMTQLWNAFGGCVGIALCKHFGTSAAQVADALMVKGAPQTAELFIPTAVQTALWLMVFTNYFLYVIHMKPAQPAVTAGHLEVAGAVEVPGSETENVGQQNEQTIAAEIAEMRSRRQHLARNDALLRDVPGRARGEQNADGVSSSADGGLGQFWQVQGSDESANHLAEEEDLAEGGFTRGSRQIE